MKNVIYCHSNDEANLDLVHSWSAASGFIFQRADQRDELFPANAGGVVMDLNHLALPPTERVKLLRRLCNVALPCPVALAYYDLASKPRDVLSERGWIVGRRMERGMFDALTKAINGVHQSGPETQGERMTASRERVAGTDGVMRLQIR